MNKTGLKQVRLDPMMIGDRDSMAQYMKRELDLPGWFGGNLDALMDCLTEVQEETVFEIEAEALVLFLPESYPRKVLKVVSRAAKENPHLHLYLSEFEKLIQL